MSQTDLFRRETRTMTRRDDPGTSREAAHYIGGSVNKLQRIVLDFIMAHRGTTDREMVDALRKEHGGSESTYRTRRAELVDMGLVAPLGLIEAAGRKHQTWTATREAYRSF